MKLFSDVFFRISLLVTTLFSFAAHAQTGPATFGGFYLKDFVSSPAPMQLTYVRVLMEQNGRYNIVFTHSAEFYRERLLELATYAAPQKHPQAKAPLAHHFAAVAVVHCDWKNDFEPLEFAEKYLGEEKMAWYGDVFPTAMTELRNHCPHAAAPAETPNTTE